MEEFNLKICDSCGWWCMTAYIDGRSKQGPWGNFCPTCWETHGCGLLGVGNGQLYNLVEGEDGELTYVKQEG